MSSGENCVLSGSSSALFAPIRLDSYCGPAQPVEVYCCSITWGLGHSYPALPILIGLGNFERGAVVLLFADERVSHSLETTTFPAFFTTHTGRIFCGVEHSND